MALSVLFIGIHTLSLATTLVKHWFIEYNQCAFILVDHKTLAVISSMMNEEVGLFAVI